MLDRRDFLKTTVVASVAAADAQLSAQSPRLFPGFTARRIQTSGASIHTLVGGSGPPLLLIHGYPQTHAEWHKIAPALAQRFTVVMTDLRGYGDSSKPPDGENHANYSKRAMALDQVEVMRALGHERFAVVGHDRGGRVTWRMCVEHPERVTRAAILDIVPLPYSMVTREFATQYFHWFFLIQPAPFPETLIGNSAEFYLRSRFQRPTGGTGARHRRGVRRVPALLQGSGDDSRHVRGLSRRRVDRSRALGRRWRPEGRPVRCWCCGASAAPSAASTT